MADTKSGAYDNGVCLNVAFFRGYRDSGEHGRQGVAVNFFIYFFFEFIFAWR